MKKFILFLPFIFLSGRVWSDPGARKENLATPTFEDYGNMTRLLAVPISTTNIVLISSAPQNAVQFSSPAAIATPGQTGTAGNLGIKEWRFREIINISTCCRLALYPDSTYNSFSSTFGVIIGSDTTGNGLGDVYVVPHQGEVWGIWEPNTTFGGAGAGAGGSENYYDSKKRR